MYLILPFVSYWCKNELIQGSIFEFQTKSNSKRARSRLVYVIIEDQNAEIAVEWEKCFLCEKDTAGTLFSCQKLRTIFQNFPGFAAIDEAPSHLLWIKSINKEDLELTTKSYHPKHHNSYTANYGSNMLAREQNKFGKIQENDSLTSPPPTTSFQSSASVMREFVFCFCHEIDLQTNLCVAGAYHAKRTKNDVKHVLNLAKNRQTWPK